MTCSIKRLLFLSYFTNYYSNEWSWSHPNTTNGCQTRFPEHLCIGDVSPPGGIKVVQPTITLKHWVGVSVRGFCPIGTEPPNINPRTTTVLLSGG